MGTPRIARTSGDLRIPKEDQIRDQRLTACQLDAWPILAHDSIGT